jgi:hypothetical protein
VLRLNGTHLYFRVVITCLGTSKLDVYIVSSYETKKTIKTFIVYSLRVHQHHLFFPDLSIIIIIFAPLPFSVRKVIEQPIVGPLCHTSLVNNLRSFSVLLNFHLGWRRYRMFDLEPSEWNQPDISFILTRERAILVRACILLVAFAHYSLAVAGFARRTQFSYTLSPSLSFQP